MNIRSSRKQVLSPIYRLTPYFHAAEQAGCLRYDIFSHTYGAIGDFGVDPFVEYRELTENVVLMEVAQQRQFVIEGKDAGALVDYLVTRDVSALEANRLCYGFCCFEDGHVITDAVIHHVDENLFWLSPTDTDLDLWIRGIVHSNKFDVNTYIADIAPLQIQGPNSKKVLRTLIGDGIENLKFFRSMPGMIADVQVVISRTGWTGELGYEIYPIGSKRALQVWDEVMRAGGPYKMRPIAWSFIRALESGILAFPHGVIDDLNPFEHWRTNLVDLDKGPFVGKEALRKVVEAGGAPRKMIGLAGASDEGLSLPPMEFPWPLLKGEEEIGVSRWNGYSPALSQEIAIGLVARTCADVGDTLFLSYPGGKSPMTVVELPFIDKEGKRPRGIAAA